MWKLKRIDKTENLKRINNASLWVDTLVKTRSYLKVRSLVADLCYLLCISYFRLSFQNKTYEKKPWVETFLFFSMLLLLFLCFLKTWIITSVIIRQMLKNKKFYWLDKSLKMVGLTALNWKHYYQNAHVYKMSSFKMCYKYFMNVSLVKKVEYIKSYQDKLLIFKKIFSKKSF